MSNPDASVAPLGSVQLPAQLAERFAEETERFHHSAPVDDDLAQADQRHEALLKAKAAAAHAQVEHAKQVAHQHGPSDPANNAPREGGAGRVHVADDTVTALEEGVESKRSAVAAQRRELSDLEARLRRADAMEQRLRAALGEA